jgi:RNA polymerase sigma-70 factor, ECF subfamily
MTSSGQSKDDEQLWAQWGSAHGPAVRGYLLGMVGRPDLADDLVQEVFCRAWRARRGYREEGNARAYLLRIADHLVCDRGRKSKREIHLNDESWRELEPADRQTEPVDRMVREEAAAQLAAALESLTPPQRRVLLLRYYGEMGFAEIAHLMECPLGTVLSHGHRGLECLRKALVGRNIR